jgi:2-hydroxy-3-keto-5-methylthiopentenyl-1-phosphate phosphatase
MRRVLYASRNTEEVCEKMFNSFSDYKGTFTDFRTDIVGEIKFEGKKYFIREVMDNTYRLVDALGLVKSGVDVHGNEVNFPRLTKARKFEEYIKKFIDDGGKIV